MIREAKPYGIENIKADSARLLKMCLADTFNCFDCPLKDYSDCKKMLYLATIDKMQKDESTIKRLEDKKIA